MAYTTGQAPRTTDKQHFDAFNVGYLSFQTMFQNIFEVVKSDRETSEFQMIAGGSTPEEVAQGANFPETNPKEVGRKDITVRVFKKKIALTQLGEATAIDKTLQQARNLGMRSRIKKDQIAASVFQNAFISTNGFGITIDGTLNALVGATQSIGDTGNTQSNKVSGALSKSTLSDARTLLGRQRDFDNELALFAGKQLIVGETLGDTANELTMASADTADNKNNKNINVNQVVQSIIWTQIEEPFGQAKDTSNDTNTELKDNWFLRGLSMENPFKFINVIPLNFMVIRNPLNGNREYQVTFAVDAKAVNYLGVVGSDGT